MLKPLVPSGWTSTTAAHLLNRAGFGGPPAAVEELVRLGIERAVSHLVDYEKIPDSTPAPAWAKPDPEHQKKLLALRHVPEAQRRTARRAEARLQRQRLIELRGWWLERMAKGPRPFQEKMTLFWHGHFATSFVKVRDAYYMWRQNDLFRRRATGNWQQLLMETGKDPAMLIWLDQARSRRPHANENFAREVMELFSLGEGHYTEQDVIQGARALTGWSLNRRKQEYVYRPRFHDQGIKTFLGRTGNLDGDDVIRQIIAQPQSAVFITAKIWNFFAGQPPSRELNTALANLFRQSGNEFKPLVRAMFLSEEFYRLEIIRNQVKSPVQWLVGSVRLLENELPPPVLAGNLIRNLGQDLFEPPNVKGWDGGLAWITTNTLLNRYNEASVLVDGDLAVRARASAGQNANRVRRRDHPLRRVRIGGVRPGKILTEAERTNRRTLIAALEKRLLQSRLSPKQDRALRQYMNERGNLDPEAIRGAIRLIMSTPEYQVT